MSAKKAGAARKNGTEGALRVVPGGQSRKMLAVRIDADLVDEARAAAAILGGMPHQMTLAQLVAAALRPHLLRMRREHNSGRPFWPAPHRLRAGRPLKIPRAE